MSIFYVGDKFFWPTKGSGCWLKTSYIFDFWWKTLPLKYLIPWMLKLPLTSVLKRNFVRYFVNKIEFYFQINSVKKSLKCPKTKPTTHCLIPNLSNKWLDHQTVEQHDDHAIIPYCVVVEDCTYVIFKLRNLNHSSEQHINIPSCRRRARFSKGLCE